MKSNSKQILKQLGLGKTISQICEDENITSSQFDSWWKSETKSRIPLTNGDKTLLKQGSAQIYRDKWGVPHIYGSDSESLFFAYGYAMAQDRLWQMDYFKRRALGRLSEVLGPTEIEQDTVSKTIGLENIAENEINNLPEKTLSKLSAFSDGINSLIKQSELLPIEFDILDYEPEKWTSKDSIAILAEFRWYLTGRLPVIAIPEFAKRTLQNENLYQEFITGEAESESIVPEGYYQKDTSTTKNGGGVVSEPNEGQGSNNWVINASKSKNNAPMVASDPHIAFTSPNCWYEAHFSGAGFNAAGAGYVGFPGIIFGRNENIAWGVTNNICAQRDLYKETVDKHDPSLFLYDGKWEKAQTKEVSIKVKNNKDHLINLITTRNGPIVDHLLPSPLKSLGPVSLNWVGFDFSDELTCLLELNKSKTCKEGIKSLENWEVPTWSFVIGDNKGDICYQSTGSIPIRSNWNRRFRDGSDPENSWQGFIPKKDMPAIYNPSEGYARSANNRLAPEDFPQPLSGVWNSGYRALRIRQMLESKSDFSREDFAKMQLDVTSMRAVEVLPHLIKSLELSSEQKISDVTSHLKNWNAEMNTDSVAASIFEIFFATWCESVAAERFSKSSLSLISQAISGLAVKLLIQDQHGWFKNDDRQNAIIQAMNSTISKLTDQIGPNMSEWYWGEIHKINLPHKLSTIGDLDKLLDTGGEPISGNGITVCNTGYDPNYLASIGANWRHNADLSETPSGIWAIDSCGQSGHPGSPNYGDQLTNWIKGDHHFLPLDLEQVKSNATNTLQITSK